MSDYLLRQGTRQTPQRERADRRQVQNSEGGYVFEENMWGRLRRFLILGTEGGSFYATEKKLTNQNVEVLRACIDKDGARTVNEIVAVSDGGLAPSNDPALFALAVALSHGDGKTRSLAAEALPKVARIGTHLFHFVGYAETQRGWGTTLRWAVSNWYRQKSETGKLAYDAVKYRQRDGWSHRDMLRLSHPLPRHKAENALFSWMTGGDVDFEQLPRIVDAFEAAQKSESPLFVAGLIKEARLPREAVNPEMLRSTEIWEALLDAGMPLHALMRNLANMTRYGVLVGARLRTAKQALTDGEMIRSSRLHPLAILIAQRTYATGVGFRGTNSWTPIPDITDALDEAFYLAFDNVQPTGGRVLLGVDVSGSMGAGGVAGSPLTPREAAVAMALVTLHAEEDVHIVGFTDRMHRVSFSRRQRLDDAVRSTPSTGEGTDCGIPIRAAQQDGATFDSIILYTDNETWAGRSHVHQDIQRYRQFLNPKTRLVACGMVANSFTVCDPSDPLSMNVVGFDASAPAIIAEFSAGRL